MTTGNLSGATGAGGGTNSCVMLVTGACDGAIHVVDVNRGGTVLAVFDCGISTDNGDVSSSSSSSSSRITGGGNSTNSTDGSNSNKAHPHLLSMAVSDVLTAPHDLALVPSTATASIFAGFSDCTVHILGVHIGMDTTDCDHYEGVWKLAYVRLQPVCVLVASASGLTLLPSTPSFPLVHNNNNNNNNSNSNSNNRGMATRKLLPGGVTALCWTQSQFVDDQPTVPAAVTALASLDHAGKGSPATVLIRKSDDEAEAAEADDGTNATNPFYEKYPEDNNDPTEFSRTCQCQGTLITGHADGTVKSWEVTVIHRIE